MSYGRVLAPRIYTCTMRSMLARGAAASCWSQIGAQPAPNTGSVVVDLLNPRPNQRTSFDTSAHTTDKLVLQFDMGIATANPINFVAIVGHNLAQAGAAEPTLRYHTSAFTAASDGTLATTLTYPCGGVTTGVCDTNGTTIITITPVTDKRYWALVIPDDSGFTSTDLEIGAVMIGSYYDFPFAPDLDVSTSQEFGGVKRMESAGGQGWAIASHLGGPGDSATIFGQPFRVNGADYRRRILARRNWDLQFSRIEDTLLGPEYGDRGLTACSTIEDVWERTCGGMLPFIFSPGGATDTYGDSAWAYFDQDSLEPKQGPSPKVWSYRLRIREDF